MPAESHFSFAFFAFSPKNGRVVLRYRLDDLEFHEQLYLPMEGVDKTKVDWDAFDHALFGLHLAGGVSYWKARCPKRITVETGTLTKDQAVFWNDFYTKGLGEFFYKNEIDFRGLVEFKYDREKSRIENGESRLKNPELRIQNQAALRPLVPVGGGKDSVVTVELLKAANIPVTAFVTKRAAPIDATVRAMDVPSLVVERELDPQLFELNKDPHTYNGHAPITGYLHFVALLTAILHGHTDVMWSLEESASEGNLEYLGEIINHQYTKSLEFERAFAAYVKTNITRSVHSFSLLRPFSELRIVEEFAKHPKYFNAFSSCNHNFTIAKTVAHHKVFWCGECEKCAFVFVALGASLPHKNVVEIFGSDLFASAALLPTLKQLMGVEGHKPFECVGTVGETIAAMELSHRRGDCETSLWMQWFVNEARPKQRDLDKLIKRVLAPSNDHDIPQEYARVLPQ